VTIACSHGFEYQPVRHVVSLGPGPDSLRLQPVASVDRLREPARIAQAGTSPRRVNTERRVYLTSYALIPLSTKQLGRGLSGHVRPQYSLALPSGASSFGADRGRRIIRARVCTSPQRSCATGAALPVNAVVASRGGSCSYFRRQTGTPRDRGRGPMQRPYYVSTLLNPLRAKNRKGGAGGNSPLTLRLHCHRAGPRLLRAARIASIRLTSDYLSSAPICVYLIC